MVWGNPRDAGFPEQQGDGDTQGHQAQSKGTMGMQGTEQHGMQGTPSDAGQSSGAMGHRGPSSEVTGALRDMSSSNRAVGTRRDTAYQLWGNGAAWGQRAPSYGVREQGHPDTQGTEPWGDGDTLGCGATGCRGPLGDLPTSFLAASMSASLSTTFCLSPKASRRLSSSRCSSRATRACSSPTSLLLLLFSLSRSFTCPRRR